MDFSSAQKVIFPIGPKFVLYAQENRAFFYRQRLRRGGYDVLSAIVGNDPDEEMAKRDLAERIINRAFPRIPEKDEKVSEEQKKEMDARLTHIALKGLNRTEKYRQASDEEKEKRFKQRKESLNKKFLLLKEVFERRELDKETLEHIGLELDNSTVKGKKNDVSRTWIDALYQRACRRIYHAVLALQMEETTKQNGRDIPSAFPVDRLNYDQYGNKIRRHVRGRPPHRKKPQARPEI